MAKDIFVIQTMGDALRNTGYKNIECAMAEIIDNSIQAEAKDILIIVSEEYNPETGRNNIKEIGFLDNGKGMEQLELESCLGMDIPQELTEKEWEDLELVCRRLLYMHAHQLMCTPGRMDMIIARKYFWI